MTDDIDLDDHYVKASDLKDFIEIIFKKKVTIIPGGYYTECDYVHPILQIEGSGAGLTLIPREYL